VPPRPVIDRLITHTNDETWAVNAELARLSPEVFENPH
jgi:hypothetical protein